jgi:hypothetical protein
LGGEGPSNVCTVQTPDGAIHQFEAQQGMTVQNAFSQIPGLGVTSNIILHAFRTTFAPNSPLIDIISSNLTQPLLLSYTNISSTPAPRDAQFELNNQHLQDIIDELIRRQWSKYDHNTCLLFGYVAKQ